MAREAGCSMSILEGLRQRFESAESFGYEETQWGARLYGHLPHVAEQAWFHRFYQGLTLQQVEELEGRVGVPFPHDFRQFLMESNGLSMFDRSLTISGLRKDYSRGPEAGSLPFALETGNNIERPAGCPASYLFIGNYFDDGSTLVIDRESGRIHWLARYQPGPLLRSWPNLKEMLESEADRLARLFDERGHLLDPNGSTLPPRQLS